MTTAAFDVHYFADGPASGAAILSSAYGDAEPILEYTAFLPEAAAYVPGEFFQRKLPTTLTLLQKFDRLPGEVLADGYVMLGDRPGRQGLAGSKLAGWIVHPEAVSSRRVRGDSSPVSQIPRSFAARSVRRTNCAVRSVHAT